MDIAVFSEGTFPPNLEGLKSEEFLAFDANGEGAQSLRQIGQNLYDLRPRRDVVLI